jgi:ABC-type amino acid transport substrate-binding protein
MDTTWFPLQLDSKTVPLTAFTTALVQEISRITSYALEVVPVDWPQLFQNLQEGHVSGIFSSLTPGLLAERQYAFSEPIVALGPVLIVREGSEAHTLLSLYGKIVAVYQYDESILVAQEFPSVIIQLYQNMPSILEDLQEGRVDGVLMPVLEAQSLVTHLYSGQLRIVSEPLNNKAIRLITCKNNSHFLLSHFNKGLQKVRQKGIYTALWKKYRL